MFHLYPVALYGLEQEFRAVKFLRAVKLIEEVINGDEFKQWFLTQKFTQLGELRFKDNDALLEQLLNTVKFTYRIVSRPWYKRYSSVIGYSINGDITTYKDSYDKMSLAEFCGHLCHEALHVLDFSHSVKYSKERDDSVPYKVGNYIIGKVTDKLNG